MDAAPDWANVPDPEEVPRPKVKIERRHDDVADVIVIGQAPPSMRRYLSEVAPKLGELHFNGTAWFFWRYDRDGGRIEDGGHYIPVDPDQEWEFRQEREAIALQPESARMALEAELEGRVKAHRDENRDLAEMGAKIEARKWWPLFWSPDNDV